jgi:hypothetical protein
MSIAQGGRCAMGVSFVYDRSLIVETGEIMEIINFLSIRPE